MTGRRRTGRRQAQQRYRRWSLAGCLGLGCSVALASVAWACVPLDDPPDTLPPPELKGELRICPVGTTTPQCADTQAGTEGRASEGSTVKVRGHGLNPKPARYTLFFHPPAETAAQADCNSARNIMKAPGGDDLSGMTTNKNGELDRDLALSGAQPYKSVIPDLGMPPGEYDVGICARQDTSSNGSRSTTAVFNVVVV